MLRRIIYITLPIIAAIALCACNKENSMYGGSKDKPVITLDSETGVYTVKVGRTITIRPEVRNASGATYEWTMNGRVISRDIFLTWQAAAKGEYYFTFTATNSAGTAREEIKVEVVDFTPPIISFAIPEGGLKVLKDTDYELAPDILHADEPDFSVRWMSDGQVVCQEPTYIFRRSEAGRYTLKIEAENADGKAEKTLEIDVVDELPQSITFPAVSFTDASTRRYTLPGRTICLWPITENITDATYVWTVDGHDAGCSAPVYYFAPTQPGEYRVKLTAVKDVAVQLTRNLTRGATETSAEVVVTCVDKNESSLLRPITAASSPAQNAVYEYIPGPGQFINETKTGGFTGGETTPDRAATFALSRLQDNLFVSLGSFGGYLVVGFDHSIVNSGSGYDFTIAGNAFDGSNEPGIVWVSQDVNGNGRPDDEWYELRGSETGKPGTEQNFAVTYFRPAAPGMKVQWVASDGSRGTVDYIPAYHDQAFYYPAWISRSSYTLYGTRLPNANHVNPSTGYWTNDPYGWGYADNMGSDVINRGTNGERQRVGFKISNAMLPDGTPVSLQFVDFVKVQQGVLAKSGALGENSCEVFSIDDYSMTK